jgi:hypothetical protein
MTHATPQANAYQEQLTRYARALATPQNAMVFDDLEGEKQQTGLGIFVAANTYKRRERLRVRLEYLAGALDDLETLLVDYVRELPLNPYATMTADADRFLGWLQQHRELTPEQRDYVACQRSHFAVEAIGRNNHLGHVRFQELLSVAHRLAAELDIHPGLRFYLNPIRVWSRLETRAMLDQETSPPTEVLLYAAPNDVRSAVLDAVGCSLVYELSSSDPLTLDEWESRSESAERATLVEFCRDLAERGIVAFG